MKVLKAALALAALLFALSIPAAAAPDSRDGSHDFDFLIGNWKAHVRVLPDRLNGGWRKDLGSELDLRIVALVAVIPFHCAPHPWRNVASFASDTATHLELGATSAV